MSEFAILGKPTPRVDGIPKVTGKAQYAADLSVAGMLYGEVLRSPYPHARILSIDTSRAERLPGVRGVITGKDFNGFRHGFMAHTRDESPLAPDKVRFIGDEVAAVAAIDPDIAHEAVELIRVEYEQLPAVFDPEEAMQEGAPAIHDHVQRNISAEMHFNFGDVEAAFARADHVREDRFYSQSVLHGFLEPHACIAQYEEPGKITFWGSKQSPYFPYRNLASAFKVPLSNVRVIQPVVGGGFGGKNDTFALDYAAVMLSKKTGHPVKFVYDIEDVLMAGRRRHPMIIYMKTGVKKDGTLLATECRVIADGGAYTAVGPMTIYLAGAFLTLPYKLPNLKYDAWRVYTNKPVSVAQRGHGVPQTRFAADCQLDLIAKDLGLDPVEIRLKNAIEPGHVTVNKIHISSCGLKETINRSTEFVNWKERKQELAKEREKGGRYLRGIGLACNGFMSGARLHGHTACAVVVKVHEDGTVSVLPGATDSGQGAETVLATMAAEVLGITLEDVHVSRVDSFLTPVDPGSYGSRVTSTAGPALLIAVGKCRTQLAEVAAKLLDAPVAEIEFRERKAFVKGDPTKQMPFGKLCRLAYQYGSGQVIIGEGYFGQNVALPNWDTGEGDVANAYTFGTQVAEVEVDRETGQVKLKKMIVAHDLGKMFNPLIVEGQHDGSIYGGMGQALYEECLNEDGLTLNPSILDYKMPTALDMPGVMESINIETNDPLGPFGAKESAEGTQVSTVPAIVNAIYDATGIMFTDLPITPEKVLRALEQKEQGGGPIVPASI
ncbi:xanthine dehydrogenase family protein molybdopterin-binding subunit [Paradesulfitobacterium ferrireducens]|uniref:xanthine dehydrogenase family protein molybdopterin-binding subunit n=1 Tax=Paradesulfitobacterium ferrireducens TaxID=2816476 RepID=UPI001A8D8ED5|nr:molybdopterin cofactor-binding domain-containing protein [Paradesulfitobacterium ferrireducens]